MSNLDDDMDLVPTAQPEEEEDQAEEYAGQEEQEKNAEEEEATATEVVEVVAEEEEKYFVENDNTTREDHETSMVERQEPEQERELVEEDEEEAQFPQIVQREPSAVAALAMPISPSRNSPTLDDTNDSNNTAPLTPTTQANLEPSATVKYLLEPSHQVITIACSLKTLMKDLRSQLASQLKMRSDYIRFILHDEGLLKLSCYFLNKIRIKF